MRAVIVPGPHLPSHELRDPRGAAPRDLRPLYLADLGLPAAVWRHMASKAPRSLGPAASWRSYDALD